MKTLKKIIPYLIVPIIIYLLAALIAWDINPDKWSFDGRAATAIIIAFSFLFILFIQHDK
jgi:hypothetical protein